VVVALVIPLLCVAARRILIGIKTYGGSTTRTRTMKVGST
jgi:hypothetical protein